MAYQPVPTLIFTLSDGAAWGRSGRGGPRGYTCQLGGDGKFAWTLKAPDAVLKDQEGQVIGSHFAGPTWKLRDGGEVTGKAAAHAYSGDPNSIQWSLVDAVAHTGNGLLTSVTTIQR